MVGALVDVCIPQLDVVLPDVDLEALGIERAPGILKDREGYPDYIHRKLGVRLELKLLYVDPTDVVMKSTVTRREASARLTQKVTVRNVVPETDVLLVVAYQLRPLDEDPDVFCPMLIDFEVFPMADCIAARDHRLMEGGGRWFGDYETPAILSRKGRAKAAAGGVGDTSRYGRKESEGHDYNEDTNFGKLKRIPLESLQRFLKQHGATFASAGTWPAPWRL
jgi:hypothetical protein